MKISDALRAAQGPAQFKGTPRTANWLNAMQASNGRVSRSMGYPDINVPKLNFGSLFNRVDNYASKIPQIFQDLQAKLPELDFSVSGGGGGSIQSSPNSLVHHVNPSATGSFGSAVVLNPGVKAKRVVVNGISYRKHGNLDKGREVWHSGGKSGISGPVKVIT